MNEASPKGAFIVNDCAAAIIGTGNRARDLLELRYQLLGVHPGCIYYHFWGTLLQPGFENPEYLNDFAEWANSGLRDVKLAEELGVLDPLDFPDLDALRREIVEVIDEHLDEIKIVPSAPPDRQFHFNRSQIIIFDTKRSAATLPELAELIPRLSPGSVFYHFIDARRRTENGEDDFRAWLRGYGAAHAPLIESIARIHPYFASLCALRERLAAVFGEYLSGVKQ
ncbi:MAG: DUF5752 family protein [Kiritimatiellia bacterium]|jgi:hypothetical protein